MRRIPLGIIASLCLLLAGPTLAQQPGAFVSQPCFSVTELFEGTSEASAGEHQGPIPLACPVFSGYVVMLDILDAAHPQQDPHNWSDVIAFTTGGPVQPGQPTDHLFFISDSADP